MKKQVLFWSMLIGIFTIANAQINFPDANFKQALLDHTNPVINTDGDEEISIAEALAVTSIGIAVKSISDLTGIEEFVNLKTLNCSSNQLTTLDLTKNINLEYLECPYNQLTTLDVTKSINLTNLNCTYNQLITLDVTKNINLTNLDCSYNQLTILDVTKNTNLTVLKCDRNKLINLDVTQNINLTNLNCYSNLLTSLDVTKSINITNLDCSNNLLTTLDVSRNINLINLNCYSNLLTTLDVSQNINLTTLTPSANRLTTLDVSQNINLTNLTCSSNRLTTLDVSLNINLISLSCSNYGITSLDITHNTNLIYLDCSVSQLTSLDITHNTHLTNLYCYNNQLTNLDVTKNTDLKKLNCFNNQLISLDVTKNTNLENLICYNNQLTTLDVRSCKLTYLYCYDNPKLETVFMTGQPISYRTVVDEEVLDLYLSGCPNLQFICADQEFLNDIYTLLDDADQTSCQLSNDCDDPHNRIQGIATFDVDNDGCGGADDVAFNEVLKVTANSLTGGSPILAYPNEEGEYTLHVADDTYSFVPTLENTTYFTLNPSVSDTPIARDIPADLADLTTDYCIQPLGIFNDLEISIFPLNLNGEGLSIARPGFSASYLIKYKNIGTTVQSGSVTLAYENDVLNYVSATPTVASDSNGLLTWNFTDLPPMETVEIPLTLILNTPTDTPPLNGGEILDFLATITGATDETPENNEMALKQLVVNSYDPNDKTCLEGDILDPDAVGEYLHYQIRFENTGTADAINISVVDVIDTTKFDITSFVPLAGSHSYTTTVTEGNEIEFIFSDINLPFDDANNDGYVVFKIKTLDTLVEGDEIVNSAAIYFDFNLPIITEDSVVSVEREIISELKTWTGNINSDWDENGNWDTHTIPTSIDDVVIPSGVTNYPTASSAITINSLVVEAGATFIPQSTVEGDVTYNLNSPTTDWYFASVPVTGETYENLIANHPFVVSSTGNLAIGSYDNNQTPSWIYKLENSTGQIPAGQGMAIKLLEASELTFKGAMITGDFDNEIIQGSSSNFNLIGNPYTSYINSNDFFATNSSLLTEQTIWIYDGSQYVTYNLANPIEIAPGQGFLVSAGTNGSITFENSSQHHINTSSKQTSIANFELSVKSNNAASSTKVLYLDDKTTDFNNGYDSKIFEDQTIDFTVFTELVTNNTGDRLAIQTLPTDNTKAIPVGLIADAGKEITFSITSLNLSNAASVYLEDKENGAFVNLSETAYKTTLKNKATGVGQFYMHTSAKSLSTVDTNFNSVSIYKSTNNEVTVSGLNNEANITVLSLLGKKVMTTTVNQNSNKVNLSNLNSGVYIVKLTSNTKEFIKKVILE